jgi:hypothetical protein
MLPLLSSESRFLPLNRVGMTTADLSDGDRETIPQVSFTAGRSFR